MENIKQIKEKLNSIAVSKVLMKRSIRDLDRDRNVYTKKLNDLENEEISLKKCFQLPFKLGGTYLAINSNGNEVETLLLIQYSPNQCQWIAKDSGNRYSDSAGFTVKEYGEFLSFDAVNNLCDDIIENVIYLHGGESTWEL